MENKIQQLTEKLYNEGVSKGKQESEQIVAQAKENAEKIVNDAKKEALEIIETAKKNAEELAKNSKSEITLALNQMVNDIKQQLQNIVITKSISEDMKNAFKDDNFVKELILSVVKSWDGSSVNVIVPEGKAAETKQYIETSVDKALASEIEISENPSIKTGFRLVPSEGGYYINFSDNDFNALFKDYLREQVATLLFGGK